MYVSAYVFAVAFMCLTAATPTPSPTSTPISTSRPATAHVEVVAEAESFLDNAHYQNNEEIGELFQSLARDYPTLAQTYTIGRTIQGRPLHALALNAPTATPTPTSDGSHGISGNDGDLLRPMVKLVANIQGDETLGRQIVLYMAEYLASSYEANPEVQKLLNTTEIHFLPSCNPDGFAAAKS
ncbi:GH24779 [Drosophila grimshawi]|uniref:GH24779 n=1 Tax=Drosophila grimshawi TaxID=7222 RepID=B4JNA2_DROGR|nr:GH24779 [Drosophila grimshawi]